MSKHTTWIHHIERICQAVSVNKVTSISVRFIDRIPKHQVQASLFSSGRMSLQMAFFEVFGQIFADHVKVFVVTAKLFYFDHHK